MKAYGAEFLGTFWLVLGGCGSAVLAGTFPQLGIGIHGIALAFGLTVLTMAFAIGMFFLLVILGATDKRAPAGFAPIASEQA